MKQKHILIIDDEPDIRNLISDILADEGYSVATAANGDEANQQISTKTPNLVLLDIWMPDIDGISLMKQWNENNFVTAPIVMMSGHGTVETAVEATRLGAKDFIEKPLSLAKLLQTVTEMLSQYDMALENDPNPTNENVLEPIGNSEAINALKNTLESLYKTKNHIFIEGQNGTGKLSIAKLIHYKRHGNTIPSVVIDGQVIDEDFHSELVKSNGCFVRAGKGTLIINNIDSLSLEQQKILLSLVKHKQYSIAGQNSVNLIEFQIISISKKNLNDKIMDGTFLSELFEIIAEVKIEVPSLEQRQEDIPELLNYFVNTLPDSEQTPYRKISFAAQNKLRNHNWNNNIQELKNTVRQLQLLGDDGEISLDEVNHYLEKNTRVIGSQSSHWYDLSLRDAREAFERDYLIHHLKKVGGRVGELAKVAGMERTHLYRKLRALDINPKEVIKP